MMCINKLEHSNTIKQPKLLSHHCATMLTGFENYNNRKMGFGPSMHPCRNGHSVPVQSLEINWHSSVAHKE